MCNPFDEDLKRMIREVGQVRELIDYIKLYDYEAAIKYDRKEFDALRTFVQSQVKILKPEEETLHSWILSLRIELAGMIHFPNLTEYERELAKDNRKFLIGIEETMNLILLKFVRI